ncbi:MAG: hypothetical protein AAGL49_07580, partial [Pseudomonadota bacterium]
TKQNGVYLVKRGYGDNPDETERSTQYPFPPLGECRAAFDRLIGQKTPWTNENNEWSCNDSEDDSEI